VTAFEQLPSATPFAPHRTATRLDPYWDGVWQFGSHAQWVSREHIERLEAAGLAARRPAALRSDPVVASARVDEDWEAKLNLLAVLSGWRTVTAEQAAAFSDDGSSSARRNRAIADLFALDVVDAGAIGAALGGPQSARGRMLRPSASKSFGRLLRPRMSYAEWVSVTGGRKFLTGGQYDRHNVLTAELALRAAEFLPVGTVLGERQAHVNTLAYTSVGMQEPPGRSQQTADAVIVRRDGVRIAVEMTASAGASGFQRKADMWARLFANRAFDDTGLAVVFVVTDRASADRLGSKNHGSLPLYVRKQVARAARMNPGTASNRTASRMFVVDWQDWFPARGEASGDFLTMRAQRPSGANGEWFTTDLLNELDVPAPTRMADPTAVISAASGLRSVPHQLRDSARPQLHALPLQRSGFTKLRQVRVNPRTGEVRESAGRSRGNAGRVTVPPRLRF
jgi:hypothetical protein